MSEVMNAGVMNVGQSKEAIACDILFSGRTISSVTLPWRKFDQYQLKCLDSEWHRDKTIAQYGLVVKKLSPLQLGCKYDTEKCQSPCSTWEYTDAFYGAAAF